MPHYCQSCDESHAMEPVDDEVARCPVCGETDPAVRRPLLLVVGASGSGKTTLLPELTARLGGECIVFDMDWLIDPFGGDVTTLDWSMLRDSWLHVAHGVAQNGWPTMILGSFLPEQVDAMPARRWIGDIHFLVLDCSDDERRRRIDARPAARTHDVEPQVAFGQWLRANVPAAVDTTTDSPAESADAVAAWARQVLAG